MMDPAMSFRGLSRALVPEIAVEQLHPPCLPTRDCELDTESTVLCPRVAVSRRYLPRVLVTSIMVAAGGERCVTEAPPLPTPGCLYSADNHPAEDKKRTSDSPLTRQKTSKERGYRPRGERQHMDSFWTLRSHHDDQEAGRNHLQEDMTRSLFPSL
ncbi:hypothetical protein NQZ68_036116 [Dissostichus eleginoides]|nr:hypothetical protein NQZ68_036116 [Dissostichus eleginoides]